MPKAVVLNEKQQQLLNGQTFGMLTVLRPDGMPSTNPVSYVWVDDTIQISTIKSRYKYKSLLNDDRVAFCVQSFSNPMEYIEVRGRAKLSDDPERSVLRATFAAASIGEPPEDLDGPGEERVAITIIPERVHSPQLYGGRFDK